MVPGDTTALSGFSVAEGRFPMRAPKGGLTNPRLVLGHILVQNPSHPNGEIVPANTLVWQAAIEHGGVTTRILFAGQTSLTLAPNDNDRISDALSLSVPAGQDYFLRFRANMTIGTVFNRRQPVNGATGAQFVVHNSGSTNQILGAGALTVPSGGSGSATSGFGPVAIIGEGSHNGVAIIGDSIAEGTNFDTVESATGAIGFAAKGLTLVNGHRIPWMNLARGGERTDTFLANGARRLLLTRHGSDIICNHGTNDIDQGRGLSALQADYLTTIGTVKAQGGRFHAVLLFPRVASGGTYNTLTGQTPRTGFTSGGLRDQFNAWLAGLVSAGTIDSVIDCISPGTLPGLADAGDPSRWAIDGGALTADGTHPNNAGATRAAARLRAWAENRGLA
jgi:lysophospholipase L1-like esterase